MGEHGESVDQPSHVPASRVREVSHILKAIHAQESRDTAEKKANAIMADLRGVRMSKAAHIVELAVQQTLAYYNFPDIHWQKIRTRRRTRVVGAFPDGQSCLNLATARLLHEYAAAISDAKQLRWSRRLSKCAKDSGP
jgi:transposase-like protein